MKKFGGVKKKINLVPKAVAAAVLPLVIIASFFELYTKDQRHQAELQQLTVLQADTQQLLQETSSKLVDLESEDQYLINQSLQKDIKQTRQVFNTAVEVYEKLTDIKKPNLEKDFAAILSELSTLNYATASTKLAKLSNDIDQAVIAAQAIKGIDLASLTISNAPPGSGYQRQKVSVDGQEFVVDIVAGDLGTTKVIVDTASDSDCRDNCPVLPVATYAARNGAFAAINGTYFCPASYPSCAGKTNSFDLLIMNKSKTYFNSDNNVYSTNPAVIFNGSSIRFVARASEWGRDTGVDGVISNFPLLVLNGQTQFGGDQDPKKSSSGTRPFIAAKGNTAYIGVIRGVTVAQAAKVLQTMGMEHAMNLDSGGSTAFWTGGSYKAGPGRDVPNAILFVRK
jgi:hypothetical protein